MVRRMVAAVVVAVACTAGLVVEIGSADTLKAPRTLADARSATVGVVDPTFPVDVVGAVWEGADDHGSGEREPVGEVRFRHGGTWTAWQAMGEDGAQAAGQFGTGLVDADDADAYQVRGLPSSARVVAINTTDGPLEEIGRVRRGAAGAFAMCRSRGDWGADESLMSWAPAFQPVQVLTVHHTDTANTDADPAATVRAIYRFHAIDRGWGDIGYQFLVDAQGVVYEGRSRGVASRSCMTAGGDGTDFGHSSDGSGRGVVGAHVSGWNSGNLGVAALGTYTTASPPAPQRSSVEDVLASLATRHGIDPRNTSYPFTNPANGATKTVATISGHRDWVATECPGGALYAALPDIRTAVANRMQTSAVTTTTTSTTTTSTTTTTTTAKARKPAGKR